jgi:hypothetical protein
MKRIFVIIAVLAAGLVGCASAGGASGGGDNYTVLSVGPQSGVKEQGPRDVHNQADFKDMWDETFSKDSTPPKMPDIDWTKQAVVAYYLGEMKHGGYTLRINRAEPSKDTPGDFDVDFLVIAPGLNCSRMTNDITHSYIIAAVPAGTMHISFNLVTRDTPPCG